MTSISLINTQDTEFTPFSKLVSPFLPDKSFAMEPNIVSLPTLIAIAIAEPLTTLLPINARFFNSSGFLQSVNNESDTFSTGSLSPVREAWLINKSLDFNILTSAGIISPAARWIISPTTISFIGISLTPSILLATLIVVFTISPSLSAALLDFVSCTKRKIPLTKTIEVTIITEVPSFLPGSAIIISVTKDIIPNINRIIVKGFIKASTNLFIIESPFWWVISFSPYSSLINSTLLSS